MELYLSQHGKAESEEEDPRRPLSAEGREETERVARAAATAGIRVDGVWHSTKLRARQTAEIFAEALKPVNGIHEQDWLGPLDDPRTAAEAARERERAVLMVGQPPPFEPAALAVAHGRSGAPGGRRPVLRDHPAGRARGGLDAALVSETGATPRLTGPGRPPARIWPLHAPDLVLVAAGRHRC